MITQVNVEALRATALRAGDLVELSGVIYTARDAAHKRLRDDLAAGRPPPVDLAGQTLFYAGPSPTPPGRPIGSIAPTTSARMDVFLEMSLKLGVVATIGKGERALFVADLCKKYGAIYFLATGGAAALLARRVKSCEVVAYNDLGTESIKKLEVERLPLIVGIDAEGRSFLDREREKYCENPA
jgi:fumarate hydratase subunit beta